MTSTGVRVLLCAALLSLPALACAQYVPAGMQGTWKVHKLLGMHGAPVAECPGGLPDKTLIGTRITLGEHGAATDRTIVEDAQPKMATMNADDFTAKYLGGSGSPTSLGLNASQVQLITFAAPGVLPFDTVMVQSPSMLIFGHCGFFYDAVRDGSFKAPKL
ncbi:MAG: hypothetical protein ACR2JE_08245 [Acidobacteriaceae bacterium]